MTKPGWVAALVLLAGLGSIGIGLTVAQESTIPRQQRVSPKVLKEALAERPLGAAVAPHTVGRSVQDLKAIAEELDKAGQKAEANRLNVAIREIVRRAEQEIADKKSQITHLNAEIDDLKWAIGQ